MKPQQSNVLNADMVKPFQYPPNWLICFQTLNLTFVEFKKGQRIIYIYYEMYYVQCAAQFPTNANTEEIRKQIIIIFTE